MGTAAYAQTGVPLALTVTDVVLWGAALAAAVCAFVIFTTRPAFLSWAAIGYVLFGALLTENSPHWPLLALAAALMPLVPRPRGSLVTGFGVALLAALAVRVLVIALL